VKKIVVGVVLLVAAASAVIFLFRTSDEKQIEKLLESCAEAAQKGDAETIIRHLDPSCTMGDQPYSALVDRLRSYVKQAAGMMVDIGSAISVSGDEGLVKLHVKVHALQHVLGEAEASLKLKKIGGEWKFVRVDEAR
jgi:hypothetical protein